MIACLTVRLQFLLADIAVVAKMHPAFCAFTRAAVRLRSVKENIDNYEYKHRRAKQPGEKILTHIVLVKSQLNRRRSGLARHTVDRRSANDVPSDTGPSPLLRWGKFNPQSVLGAGSIKSRPKRQVCQRAGTAALPD
jgi:hypothetical protein